ncbi:polysaccharide biosynthesis/export family protein [Sphingomonas sp. BK235]|uniref:polysaccharide biosynthesis/export family protein n=1 Tax=Sphingomonas sp. BK235 TaxID=2512131 RepID=UPI0010D9BAD7|nr:polysaccharide biosynthesis/export family protein [Sphingomonas sp. BK235]TCP34091.1 polysaccharide export outer membrane protein [Sphingomonas sp. BK235]
MRITALWGLILLANAGVVSAQTGPATAPAPVASAASPAYLLGPGDKVQIAVYGEQELTGEQLVGPDGSVTLPLIGRVIAKGRSVNQVSEDIRARLADGFVQNPSVAVTIVAYRPFYILGEVNTPGQYEYAQGMTVLSAVARAGGFTYRAKKGEVFVKREGDSREYHVKVTNDLLIQPGDTIRVGERYF